MLSYYLNKDGSIIDNKNNLIDTPAVCYVPEDNLKLGTGEYEVLANNTLRYNESAYRFKIPTAYCVNLAGIEPKAACYIMNEMESNPLSEFMQAFHQHMKNGSVFPWIQQVMSNV